MVTFQNVDLADDVLTDPFPSKEASIVLSTLTKEISDLQILVIFVDERLIRDLNVKFREKDESTDVLSFSPPFKEVDIVLPSDVDPGGAEVYVCPRYIVSQLDDRYGQYDQKKLLEEIYRMIIHGILHVGGWEHVNTFDYNQTDDIEPMFIQQESLLEKILNQMDNEDDSNS